MYVCLSMNAFYKVLYKPFRPIICPVVRCLESSDQDMSGTAALVPYVEDEVNRNTNRKDPEYIRSLFQIPCALDSVRVRYVYYAPKSSRPLPSIPIGSVPTYLHLFSPSLSLKTPLIPSSFSSALRHSPSSLKSLTCLIKKKPPSPLRLRALDLR